MTPQAVNLGLSAFLVGKLRLHDGITALGDAGGQVHELLELLAYTTGTDLLAGESEHAADGLAVEALHLGVGVVPLRCGLTVVDV